jgi:hypothetical protein
MQTTPQAPDLPTGVRTALSRYAATGWGGELPDDDIDAVHDFVISTLHRVAGVDVQTAIKLVHVLEGGNWSKGWERGYGTAKNHFTPKFSLSKD